MYCAVAIGKAHFPHQILTWLAFLFSGLVAQQRERRGEYRGPDGAALRLEQHDGQGGGLGRTLPLPLHHRVQPHVRRYDLQPLFCVFVTMSVKALF